MKEVAGMEGNVWLLWAVAWPFLAAFISLFAEKKARRNRRRESIFKKCISVFYLVFYRRKYYYDSGDCDGSPGGNVCTFERTVKILYYYGNGSHWIPYRCSKAYQKWRKADFHGTLLLDRNHDCFSCDAACDASLVKFL